MASLMLAELSELLCPSSGILRTKEQCFGAWSDSCPHVKDETPTLLGTLEREIQKPCNSECDTPPSEPFVIVLSCFLTNWIIIQIVKSPYVTDSNLVC
jgi:hypothetical protein